MILNVSQNRTQVHSWNFNVGHQSLTILWMNILQVGIFCTTTCFPFAYTYIQYFLWYQWHKRLNYTHKLTGHHPRRILAQNRQEVVLSTITKHTLLYWCTHSSTFFLKSSSVVGSSVNQYQCKADRFTWILLWKK